MSRFLHKASTFSAVSAYFDVDFHHHMMYSVESQMVVLYAKKKHMYSSDEFSMGKSLAF